MPPTEIPGLKRFCREALLETGLQQRLLQAAVDACPGQAARGGLLTKEQRTWVNNLLGRKLWQHVPRVLQLELTAIIPSPANPNLVQEQNCSLTLQPAGTGRAQDRSGGQQCPNTRAGVPLAPLRQLAGSKGTRRCPQGRSRGGHFSSNYRGAASGSSRPSVAEPTSPPHKVAHQSSIDRNLANAIGILA